MRLDGSVPQKQRQELVHQFQTDADCRLFLTTNAGSTGLNLQAANTVINVDLPWNPAVLEQRIARAHRMGQTQPVQVFVLVTEGTIEENLLATLAAKKDLALAALDAESEVDAGRPGQRHGGAQEPAGSACWAPSPKRPSTKRSSRRAQQATRRDFGRPPRARGRRRRRTAGGRLQVPRRAGRPAGAAAPPPESLVANLRHGLGACVEDDPTGKPRLTITLPDQSALDNLAQTLAKLLATGETAKP